MQTKSNLKLRLLTPYLKYLIMYRKQQMFSEKMQYRYFETFTSKHTITSTSLTIAQYTTYSPKILPYYFDP